MSTEQSFEQLQSKDPKVKYGYAKTLLKTSADDPKSLYPSYDFFVQLTDSPNNVLKWTAIDILGNLSAVDDQNKTTTQMPRLYSFLKGGQLITCNHAIYALGQIAHNKPELAPEILQALLKVRSYPFDTDDCRDIATGKVIEVLETFKAQLKGRQDCIDFLNTALQSQRPATQKKAQHLLKELQK